MMKLLVLIMQKGQKIILTHLDDLNSLRITINWIFCLFYLWLTWYCVTHDKEVMGTAITVTGGIVSVIISNYVISKTVEKIKGVNNINGQDNQNNGSNQ